MIILKAIDCKYLNQLSYDNALPAPAQVQYRFEDRSTTPSCSYFQTLPLPRPSLSLSPLSYGSHELSAQLKLIPSPVCAAILRPLLYSPATQIAAPTNTHNTFTASKHHFRHEGSMPSFQPTLHPARWRFIWQKNIPERPYVNQLANSALVRPSRSLKTGTPSLMSHATTHRTDTMAIQMVHALAPLEWRRSSSSSLLNVSVVVVVFFSS